jgi:uncharacterized protein YceK
MRRPALAAAATCALLVSGCGSTPGDILGLGISGGPQRAPVRMHVTEDGRGSCNSNPLHNLPDPLVLDARNIVREAKPISQKARSFGPPRRGLRTFELRTPDGTTDWVENAPNLPAVLPQAELLALQLQRLLC